MSETREERAARIRAECTAEAMASSERKAEARMILGRADRKSKRKAERPS